LVYFLPQTFGRYPNGSFDTRRCEYNFYLISYDFVEKGGNMKLYSYIVTHDTGFSPNPYWGYCTLACCKPIIRRNANIGDWMVGISTKSKGHRLIYAMEVNEILPFEQYHKDPRFKDKIPDFKNPNKLYRFGDNIYKPLPNGEFKQLPSMHSSGALENYITKQTDLNGKNVLVSTNFWYFGSEAIALPNQFHDLIAGRGYKCRFPEELVKQFLSCLQLTPKPKSILSPPTKTFCSRL
jgi:hypothetical protein